MNRSCVRCHRPDEMAPMSLLTYSDARPWARAIKERVSKREMPPWFLDKTIGIQRYKEDPSLTDEEVATIVKWVDAGAPQGNPADAPPVPKADDTSTWKIGKPDLVVQYPAFHDAGSRPGFVRHADRAVQHRPRIATSRRSRAESWMRTPARSFTTRCRLPSIRTTTATWATTRRRERTVPRRVCVGEERDVLHGRHGPAPAGRQVARG